MALSLAIKESKITITNTIPDDVMVTAIPAYLDSIFLIYLQMPLNIKRNATFKYYMKNRRILCD
jgi:hypothetical protein